jgi:hypothetical protein
VYSDDQIKENKRDVGSCVLRGEEKFVQGCGRKSGRKLAVDLENLAVGLTIPLTFVFK